MKRTIERVRDHFRRTPGSPLSVAQLQEHCGADAAMCQAVLDAFVDVKFLRVNADGTYVRLTVGPFASERPASTSAETRIRIGDVG